MVATTPSPWLFTSRIALREFTPADFDDLYRLDSDTAVMRYVNGGRPLTHAEVRDALARILRDYPNYPGLGVWHATRRDTGAFIGWFCLKYCAPQCDVELGYRLVPAAWSRGFATEGARALVRHAFAALGLLRVIAVTHPDNAASQRVLLKSGLADAGWARYHDRPVRLFAALRDAGDARRCGEPATPLPVAALASAARRHTRSSRRRPC